MNESRRLATVKTPPIMAQRETKKWVNDLKNKNIFVVYIAVPSLLLSCYEADSLKPLRGRVQLGWMKEKPLHRRAAENLY